MNKPYKEIQKDAEQALLDLRVASVEIGKRIATERIIKLVEAWGCGSDNCPEWDSHERQIELCVNRNDILELIKGEQK